MPISADEYRNRLKIISLAYQTESLAKDSIVMQENPDLNALMTVLTEHPHPGFVEGFWYGAIYSKLFQLPRGVRKLYPRYASLIDSTIRLLNSDRGEE